VKATAPVPVTPSIVRAACKNPPVPEADRQRTCVGDIQIEEVQLVRPSRTEGDTLLKPKFIPQIVRSAPSVVGALPRSTNDMAGASNEKNCTAVPAFSVILVPTIRDAPDPKLCRHAAAVLDTQEDVAQDVNPITTVAEISARPNCKPSTIMLVPDVVGPLFLNACEIAGASNENELANVPRRLDSPTAPSAVRVFPVPGAT